MNSEKIYEKLRDKTIWLELAPESILRISELANEFQVSRTPVKEALIRLKAEGWVLGRGSQFVVTPLSLERFREITEIRMILEVGANVLAMNRFSLDDFRTLDKIEKAFTEFDGNATNRQLAEVDFNFHCFLYRATKNHHLAQHLIRMLAQLNRFWLSLPKQVDPGEHYKAALPIFQAIREKDETGLKEATAAHIRWAAEGIMAYF